MTCWFDGSLDWINLLFSSFANSDKLYELDFSFTNPAEYENIRITVVFGYDILFIFIDIAKYPIIPQSAVKNEKVLNDIEYNLQLQSCFADYVVVGSDSGRIVILEYIPQKNTFEKVSNKTLIFNMTIDSYFIELFQ